MERLQGVSVPGMALFTDAQVAQRSTWGGVPDNEMTMAALHRIHQVPVNGSTCTYVNPLDPGDGGWLDHGDAGFGTTVPAGRY